MNALIAGGLGALSASSLLSGAVLTIWLRPSNQIVVLIMGFGSGMLFSAVAYQMVPELVVPYLTLLPLNAAYDRRDVFDAARWLVRTGAA